MVNRQILATRWAFGGQKGISCIPAGVAPRRLVEGRFHVLREQMQGEEGFRQNEKVVKVRERKVNLALKALKWRYMCYLQKHLSDGQLKTWL